MNILIIGSDIEKNDRLKGILGQFDLTITVFSKPLEVGVFFAQKGKTFDAIVVYFPKPDGFISTLCAVQMWQPSVPTLVVSSMEEEIPLEGFGGNISVLKGENSTHPLLRKLDSLSKICALRHQGELEGELVLA